MKRYAILLGVMLVLFGCKKTNIGSTAIKGNIEGLKSDTLLLYGNDGWYDRVDTIIASGGSFSTKVSPDTITYALLALNNEMEYPIFFSKNEQIKISGQANDFNSIMVKGNPLNDEFQEFKTSIKGIPQQSKTILKQKAETFIKRHPSSLVSIYILEKYIVEKGSMNIEHVNSIIQSLSGLLLDTPYVLNLKNYMANLETANEGKYAYSFNLKDIKGTYVSRSSEQFKQKKILLHFWASWGDDKENSQANKELQEIYNQYKSNASFKLLSISFDTEKSAWKKGVNKYNLGWKQVCEFNGLNSDVAQKFAITHLPTTVILSADGQILARDLWGKSLKDKINSIVKGNAAKPKDKSNK